MMPVERDFFEDLSSDDHFLWEVHQFIRLHHKELNEEDVAKMARDLILTWVDQNLVRAELNGTHITPDDLSHYVREHYNLIGNPGFSEMRLAPFKNEMLS